MRTPAVGPLRDTYCDPTTLPGELEILERLLPRLVGSAGEVWAGDDAAVVPGVDGPMLLCADAVVAGIHADLALVGLDDFGWKAVAVNVSDIAAMGGHPRWVVVTVSGPLADTDVDLLYDGILAAAAEYGCPVVGGDITSAPVLVVSVAMVGDMEGGAEPVLRSGARPGDTVLVTGPLGGSAAGLELLRSGRADDSPELVAAHRRPRARVVEGAAARRGGATAMIDVSDGLALDISRLAAASGVGIELDRVPVAPGVEAASGDAQAMALGGGEDYELAFTATDPDRVEVVFAAAGLRPPLRIGRCSPGSGLYLRGEPLEAAGWEHR